MFDIGKFIKRIFYLWILIVVVIAVVPLNYYYQYVEKHFKPLNLTDISGSVVKGSAKKASYMTLPLGQINWLVYPAGIDSVGGKIKLAHKNYNLAFGFKKKNDEQILLKTVRGFFDWELLKPFINIRYGELSGYVDIDIPDLAYHQDKGLLAASGTLRLTDFKIKSPAQKNLGEITMELETKSEGMIVGQFSSVSDYFQISGSLFIQPRRWQLNMDIIPRPGRYELDAIINNLGSPRRGGGRKLNLAGFY